MTKSQRNAAAKDLTEYFLYHYTREWRLMKVVALQKMLAEKYTFFPPVILQVNEQYEEAVVAQEVTSGLLLDAISECIQYVEDLFALQQASLDPSFFIKSIITYNAGKVTGRIKQFEVTPAVLAKFFYYPPDVMFTDSVHQAKYQQGKDIIETLMKDILSFYAGFEFFYLQYKHGLTAPLTVTGRLTNQEMIEKDKRGESDIWLAVYDNLNLHSASRKKSWKSEDGVFIPALTENVRNVITELHDENNLLRLAFPGTQTSMSYFVDTARKIRHCLDVFVHNFFLFIQTPSPQKEFYLPANHLTNKKIKITYEPDQH